MMTDERKALFFSTIAYGIVFCLLLATVGLVTGEHSVLTMAVLVAAGSYLTQATAAIFQPAVSLILWALTLSIAATGIWMVVF